MLFCSPSNTCHWATVSCGVRVVPSFIVHLLGVATALAATLMGIAPLSRCLRVLVDSRSYRRRVPTWLFEQYITNTRPLLVHLLLRILFNGSPIAHIHFLCDGAPIRELREALFEQLGLA